MAEPSVDLGRIKRNAKRMADQGAPENEIDDYVRTEGASFEQLAAFKGFGGRPLTPEVAAAVERRAAPTTFREANAAGSDLSLADSLSIGAFTPVAAALTAAGKSVGKIVTGQRPDPVGDYRQERDVQDELIRRHREASPVLFNVPVPYVGDVPVSQTTAKEMAISLPFMGLKGVGADVASAATAPVRGVLGQLFDSAKTGAKFGGAYGFNSARGGVEEHVANTAGHAAAGATLGPVLHGGVKVASEVPSALGNMGRFVTGRSAPNVASNSARAAEFADANVREFGPEVGGRLSQFTGRGLANSVAGSSLRGEAAGTIDDITRNAQNMLARHTEGMPVNDLGADLQSTLRQNLAEHSLPSNQINRMAGDELQAITGRMGESGFAPPPPSVQPIPPRPVAPVRAAEINPDQVPFEMAQPRPVQRGEVKPTYPSPNDIPPPAKLVQEAEILQRELAGASADAMSARRRFDEVVSRTGRDPAEVEAWMTTPAGRGRYGPEVASAYEAAESAARAAETTRRRLEMTQRHVELQRDKAWRESVKGAHSRAEADVESAYIREQSAAAREASEATQVARQKAIREAQMKAEADAAAETARLRSEAIAEAEAATERARQKAMADYNATTPKAGFTPGQSRESYPTEFAAAYEQAARVTPEYRMNPMGGPTAEGRSAKTATRDIVDGLADEAHRRLHLKGKPFDETGAIAPEFEKYLKDRLGNEIGHRIAELSRTRPGHDALTPRGLKELRSEIRAAAERAERPPYPEMPRTAEAAALRRLHGALTEDMSTFAKSSGGPAPRFTTETMAGEYVGPQSTKIGNLPPSDRTVYLKPEHMDRLTGSQMPPDTKGRLPATRSYEIDGKAIALKRNDVGEVDRATRVPFSDKPEVGLRPMQTWTEGHGVGRVHYGSPITTRAQSPGEHGAAIMSAVDRAYAKHLEEIRAPLGKLFGEKTEPIKAMDMLLKAAEVGDLYKLRPFMRVMNEKANPTKAAAAIVTHATNGAKTMREFSEGLGKISKESRDVLMASPEGKSLRAGLEKLEVLAKKMAPYEKAIQKAGESGLKVRDVPLGMMMFYHFVPTVTAYAGAAGVSRFMASPRFVKWLTDAAPLRSPGQINTHVDRLGFLIEASSRATGRSMWRDSEESKKVREGVKVAAKATIDRVAFIGKANAADSGEQPADDSRMDTGPAPKTGFDELTERISKAAVSKGLSLEGTHPQDVINSAWDASPTDAMASDIEFIAKKYRLQLPWESTGK